MQGRTKAAAREIVMSRFAVLLVAVATAVFVGGWAMGRASSSIVMGGGTMITDCGTASPGEDENVLEHVTFSHLSSFLLRRYPATAEPQDSKNTEDEDLLLYGALEAMDAVEKDGIPIPVQGYPYLFVGGIGAAYNLEALLEANITHIINVSPSISRQFPQRFTYLHINTIHDNTAAENALTSYFSPTADFIEGSRRNGGKILVHCRSGRSRSVTILIAYLIKYHGMTDPQEALKLIQTTRPRAGPNKLFMSELEAYAAKINNG